MYWEKAKSLCHLIVNNFAPLTGRIMRRSRWMSYSSDRSITRDRSTVPIGTCTAISSQLVRMTKPSDWCSLIPKHAHPLVCWVYYYFLIYVINFIFLNSLMEIVWPICFPACPFLAWHVLLFSLKEVVVGLAQAHSAITMLPMLSNHSAMLSVFPYKL